ncbi:23S rRNA (pseudouridine(1915)-N(3))-methyltransferase RlmH [Bacteroidales bacterium OttesenSCG-928-K03]|nr:23S rRNA (pseudouridine(1915)-N(3))-methyltransferase RlmH [Odoribacter sp. OttesenSCG-928-L07]MDL2238639.1 23S rRNA (pseudouridine(1915)-N(3))-methyltransferase RlmH [Bacteroidales bacterium OttesenSCG-928-L14]MDL2240274.1 23S rRNA (pseudouridine(1915)-N(3))-methyltransferase RlmH [Bacteroidales bacterium OttesenSCG-928-K22]MDL2242709.1 23S rRNA (pseudouridine(1915)-N(3))-methyltransferase RlmH [Bacteroidales bacterium OttesenSCG-928-K03]
MKITLLLCGKTSEKWISEGMNIYSKRIKNYISFEEKIIPDLKNSSKLSVNEIKSKEGEQILNEIDTSDFLILLDENGNEFSSISFANELQKQMNSGRKRVVFLIGGPYGFSQEVYKRANMKISLSQMTFSHQIVRVIFLEQLYRAFSILNNEPYHHQ